MKTKPRTQKEKEATCFRCGMCCRKYQVRVDMVEARRISDDLGINWNEFKERFYRRNIIIHNSGKPNKLYRTKTGYDGEDERLTVSKVYLKDSIRLFKMMSDKIALTFKTKVAQKPKE